MKGDYVYQAVKGIKKSFDNGVKNKLMSYKDSRLFTFDTTAEWSEIFTSTEGMTGAKELSEAETPPTLKLEDGYSVTISNKRFGGAIELTEDDRMKAKDRTWMVDKFVQRQRNQLMRTNVHLFLTNAFLMYNDAFDGTYYTAPDGNALAHDTHTWASGNTYDNKSTDALDAAAVDTAMEWAGAFTDPAGKPMPVDLDTIVVKKGSPNSVTAKKLFAKNIKPVAVNDINIYEGMFTIIETPYITTANKAYWFMQASSEENPLYVGISKMPSLNKPIRQNNEAVRSNVTGYWKQGIVNMPKLYCATGAA